MVHGRRDPDDHEPVRPVPRDLALSRLPSRLREGSGEGAAEYVRAAEAEPAPNPSRKREGYRSHSVAWTVATAVITAPIRTAVWIASAVTPAFFSTCSWLSMHMPQPFIALTRRG